MQRLIRCLGAFAALCVLVGTLLVVAPVHLIPVQAKEHHAVHHHHHQRKPQTPTGCQPDPNKMGPLYGGPLQLNAQKTPIPLIGPGTPIPVSLQCITVN